jgi:hypothetical protein
MVVLSPVKNKQCKCGNTKITGGFACINKLGEPLEFGNLYVCGECKRAWKESLEAENGTSIAENSRT